MNQQQRKYFRERIERVYKDTCLRLNEKYTHPGKTLSAKECYDLVKAGKVKLKPWGSIRGCYGYFRDYYDFSEHCWDAKPDKKLDPLLQKLRDSRTATVDAAMLGDDSQAYAMLAKFISVCKQMEA